MFENYIFDFGNVLARYYPDELTAFHIRDKKTRDTVSKVVFDRLYWNGLDDGTVTDAQVHAGIRSRLEGELADIGCTVYDNWIKNLPPVEGMVQLVRDIKASGAKLYLLSNISRGFAESFHQNPWVGELLDSFDGLVFSGPIGIVKPDREIFEHILKKYDLDPKTSVFIDDSEKNVRAAEALGITAYLFDGNADKLRSYIKEKDA